MADNTQIINLYTELAENPSKDFGWDKGLKNALAHGYKQEWIDKISSNTLEFCAAVGNPFKSAEIEDVECTGHNHYTTAETTKGATFKQLK